MQETGILPLLPRYPVAKSCLAPKHAHNTGQFDRTITQVTRDSESMRGGTRQGRTLLYVSVCFVFV
jgi:hypothetical protein